MWRAELANLRKWNLNLKSAAFWRLPTAVLVLALLSVIFLLRQNDPVAVSVISEESFEPIGTVQLAVADIRQRPQDEDDWFRAEKGGEVIPGDLIYSGVKSQAMVKLVNGAEVNLSDEVLVIFQDLDRILVSDGSRGTVQLKLHGSMKISFSGKMAEFKGENTELVFQLDGNSTSPVQFEVVNGRAKVLSGSSSRELTAGQSGLVEKGSDTSVSRLFEEMRQSSVPVSSILNIRKNIRKVEKQRSETIGNSPALETRDAGTDSSPLPTHAEAVESVDVTIAQSEAASVEEEVRIPLPIQAADTSPHVYRVAEIYQRIGASGLNLKQPPKIARARITMQIDTTNAPTSQSDLEAQPVYFQISQSRDFSKIWLEAVGNLSGLSHAAWPIGESFWRASFDKLNWSQPVKVHVTAGFDESRNPSIELSSAKRTILRGGPKKPAVAKLKFRERLGSTKTIAWVLHASTSQDFPQKKTKYLLLTKPVVSVPIKKPGRYYFRVQAIDDGGRLSGNSSVAEAYVAPLRQPLPIPKVPVRLAEAETLKDVKVREIAAVEESKRIEELRLKEQRAEEVRQRAEEKAAARAMAMRLEKERVDKIMEKLLNRERHYYVGLEGSFQGAFFDESQAAAATGPTTSQLLGIKAGFDSGRTAFKLDYRQDPSSPKSAASGADLGASRFDVRYETWYRFEENIFNRPMRYGFFGGYSHYRIRRSGEITQPFDLMKFGLALEIEIWNRWRTGGDFIFGKWLDSNQTFEANGFMNYSLTKFFDLGVGYRVNMYDGGEKSDAGVGIPFRGIVGEAYSGFRYSF